MSTISPEGYKITRDPVNNNPFWEIEIDGAHIKSLICSKTTEDQYDYYNWSYVDELDESHHIITQKVANAAGITFTPSVSPEGVISWTNDGGLPNPSPVNIKGLKGDTGNTGATGATPNITMTATADATASATPTVVVTKTGTAENPSYAFAFSGLKGEQGPRGVQGADGAPGEQGLPGVDGVTPVVSAQATVSQTTGVPSVTVTKTGSDAAPVFTFAFDNIKGETGAQGEKGDPGDVGAMPVISATASVDSNVGTPSVVVTKSGTAAAPNLAFAFSNIKGETGAKGDKGDPGEDGMGTIAVGTTTTGVSGTQASVVNSGTAQNAILDFTIPQGAQGVQGVAGQDGDDGFSPIVTVTDHATYHHIEIQDAVHTEQFDVYDGADGQQGPAGQGVPTGGTAGQVLAKVDGTDYNTEWVTPSGGGGEIKEYSTTAYAYTASGSTTLSIPIPNAIKTKKIIGVVFQNDLSIQCRIRSSSTNVSVTGHFQYVRADISPTEGNETEFNVILGNYNAFSSGVHGVMRCRAYRSGDNIVISVYNMTDAGYQSIMNLSNGAIEFLGLQDPFTVASATGFGIKCLYME